MSDEFYVGYLSKCPPGLAKHTRRMLGALAVVVVVVLALVAARQTPAEPGVFEFGTQRSFAGILLESPLPRLRVPGPAGTVTNFLIVGSGKFGLPAFARGHEGRSVRFSGTLIRKGAARMIEMNDPSSFLVLPGEAATPATQTEPLGAVSLTGELVDTKCYFGVMRPATGKVHRACAVRCLSGGVPPGLLVSDREGNGVVVMLTGENGRPAEFNVEWAARVVEVDGHLRLEDGTLVLEAASLRLSPGY
jgi:hypothetical protein